MSYELRANSPNSLQWWMPQCQMPSPRAASVHLCICGHSYSALATLVLGFLCATPGSQNWALYFELCHGKRLPARKMQAYAQVQHPHRLLETSGLSTLKLGKEPEVITHIDIRSKQPLTMGKQGKEHATWQTQIEHGNRALQPILLETKLPSQWARWKIFIIC